MRLNRRVKKIILEEIESIEHGSNLIVQDDEDENSLKSISEVELRKIISGHLQEKMIAEGAVDDTTSNVFQTLIGAAIEYAPALVAGVPTAGAGAAPGLAAGATVQTVVDCAMAVEPISSAVEAVATFSTNIAKSFDLFKDLIKIITDFQKNPNALYAHVNATISKSVKLLGEKWVAKLKDQIEKVISKIGKSLVKGVHAIIPDAAVAGSVSQIVVTLVNSLDNNCFNILKGISSVLGSYGNFIFNPSETKAFFEKAVPATIEFLKSIKEKIKDISYSKTILAGALTGGALGLPMLLTKAGGPAVLDKFIKLVEDNKSTIIDIVYKVSSILIPAFVGMVATIQSISNEDWKPEKIAAAAAKSAAVSAAKSVAAPAAPAAPTATAQPQENLAEIKNEILKIEKSLKQAKRQRL